MNPNLTAGLQRCLERLTGYLQACTGRYPQLQFYSFSYESGREIRQATRLLIETEWTCEQVGLDCGFSSYGYFKRMFEREHGVSPKGFRVNFSKKSTK